jgi:hypothetical protein
MPVISWDIKRVLHLGVRLTILGPMILTLRARSQDGEASVTRGGLHSSLVHVVMSRENGTWKIVSADGISPQADLVGARRH